MRYKVEGGTAHIGTDMVLDLSKDQVEARAHVLEKVEGGYRPKTPVQFKAGEEIGIKGSPDALPRSLAVLLVPQGAKTTLGKARSERKRSGKKTAAPVTTASA